MSLEEANKKLYERDPQPKREPEAGEVFHSNAELERERQDLSQTESWKPKPETIERDLYLVNPEIARRRKRFLWAGIGALLLILAGAGGYFAVNYYLRGGQLGLSVTGPQSVASAEEVAYRIAYRNDSRTAFAEAKLTIRFAETFRPVQTPDKAWSATRAEKTLGTLAAGATGEEVIQGKFYGPKNEQTTLEAVLEYVPAGSSGRLQALQTLPITIATAPVSLEIEAPRELGAGQELDYVITYRNASPEALQNVRLQLSYPQGFLYFEARPGPQNGDNEWQLGDLAPGSEGKIVAHGALSGNPSEFKNLTATLGVLQEDGSLREFNRAERGTRIIASPLTITQTVNDVSDLTALPGDTLTYKIRYGNQGPVGLREAVITQSLDTAMLDVSRLDLPNGFYDAAEQKIIWRASDIPALSRLEPGATGEISFSIPIREQFSREGSDSGSASIRSIATIDSPDIQTPLGQNKIIGSNVLSVKVGALAVFDLAPNVSDTPFENTGPVPPIAGQETTYTIRVRAGTSSNELSGGQATIALPSGVRYREKSSPSGTFVQWNSRTNELAWDVGTLQPGTPRELSFQVSVTPNESQVGKTVTLISKAGFTARERFTGRTITVARQTIENSITGDRPGETQSGIVQRK